MIESGPSSLKVLVIGIGNFYRSDDAAGLIAARRLRDKNLDRLIILEQSGEGTSLMESWKEYSNVILVDAVSRNTASGESKPGTVHRFDTRDEVIPSSFFSCSTHNFGVAEAVEMARTLNRLPQQLIIYGIEAKIFQPGEGLSGEVERAVDKVVGRILEEINRPNK